MDLDGHRAGSWTDQTHDGLLCLEQQTLSGLCNTLALVLLLFVGHQRVPDEFDALLQSHGGVPARIPGAGNIREQRGEKKIYKI